MHKLLILLSCFFILTGQTCKQKNGKKSNDCQVMGTIKDFKGLDGCGFMIVLEDGSRLQPVKYSSKNLEIKDGQNIRFNYEEITNQVGICIMIGDWFQCYTTYSIALFRISRFPVSKRISAAPQTFYYTGNL